jgi:hypothetical protein
LELLPAGTQRIAHERIVDVAAAVFLADGRSGEGSVATGPCQVETSLLEKHGVVFFSAAAAAAEKRVEVEVGRSGDKGEVVISVEGTIDSEHYA